MKKLLCIFLAGVSLFGAQLKVKVSNILNNNGNIQIGLYNNPDEFAKPDVVAYRGKVVKADTNGVEAVFEELPEGVYGVSIFHDENANKKLDTNFFGIPAEGYGFSNNHRPMFRGANFEESKFDFSEDKAIEIKMGY